MEKLEPGSRLPQLNREFQIRADDVGADDDRSVELVFSSESPVERYFGEEVLAHDSKKNIRLERINNAGPVLVNHNPDDQVGVVEHAQLDSKEKVGRAKIRFGKSQRAQEIFQDVRDGIRQLVSVGYRIDKAEVQEREGMPDLVRATEWTPHELSLVAIPADLAAGVGRTAEDQRSLAVDVIKLESPHKAGEGEVVPAVAGLDRSEKKNENKIEIMNNEENKPAPAIDLEAERAKIAKDIREQNANYDRQADAVMESAKDSRFNIERVKELINEHRMAGDVDALTKAIGQSAITEKGLSKPLSRSE